MTNEKTITYAVKTVPMEGGGYMLKPVRGRLILRENRQLMRVVKQDDGSIAIVPDSDE